MPATTAAERYNYLQGTTERQCVDCREWFPATVNYFVSTGHIRSDGTPRLRPRCGENANNCYAPWEEGRRAARRSGVQMARRPRRVGSRNTTGRGFGVEIEFVGNRSMVAEALRAAGLNCETQEYNHRVSRSVWKVITDATVGGGGELVSPVLFGEDGREQIRLACEALRQAGATVNSNCGLHVHHDCRDLAAGNLLRFVQAYAAQQITIDGFVAPSRRSSQRHTYCSPVSASILGEIERLCGHVNRSNGAAVRDGFRYIDRYRTINTHAYYKYGTVEIRQHGGTTEADKIISWIDFGQALINWSETAEDVTTALSTTALLSALMAHGNLPVQSGRFLAERAAHFIRRQSRAA